VARLGFSVKLPVASYNQSQVLGSTARCLGPSVIFAHSMLHVTLATADLSPAFDTLAIAACHTSAGCNPLHSAALCTCETAVGDDLLRFMPVLWCTGRSEVVHGFCGLEGLWSWWSAGSVLADALSSSFVANKGAGWSVGRFLLSIRGLCAAWSSVSGVVLDKNIVCAGPDSHPPYKGPTVPHIICSTPSLPAALQICCCGWHTVVWCTSGFWSFLVNGSVCKCCTPHTRPPCAEHPCSRNSYRSTRLPLLQQQASARIGRELLLAETA
jgi:hypothetical protein